MKLVVGSIVYNEELLVESALRSIYPFADEIVVVDGSPIGPSTDRTAEKAANVGPRVKVVSGTFANKIDQRNEYIKYFSRGNDVWLLTVDGDEIWSRDNLIKVMIYASGAPLRENCIKFHYLHFWKYFNYHITTGIWDTIHTRMHRLLKGSQYASHSCLSGPNGAFLSSGPVLDNVFCHHYGHAQGWEKEFSRYLLYEHRGDYGQKTPEQCEVSAKSRADCMMRFVNGESERKKIKKYTGSHPLEVQWLLGQHPGFLLRDEEATIQYGANYSRWLELQTSNL